MGGDAEHVSAFARVSIEAHPDAWMTFALFLAHAVASNPGSNAFRKLLRKDVAQLLSVATEIRPEIRDGVLAILDALDQEVGHIALRNAQVLGEIYPDVPWMDVLPNGDFNLEPD